MCLFLLPLCVSSLSLSGSVLSWAWPVVWPLPPAHHCMCGSGRRCAQGADSALAPRGEGRRRGSLPLDYRPFPGGQGPTRAAAALPTYR